MGISVEQYRSRIGSHDNFVKTKDALARFRDHFWNIMLMMFYLNVFYLPTLKQVVGQYKLRNEVLFWFTQIMYYNVYIPLLIRQANDVEENPGPTIFDIIDSTRTLCADYSQGNEALFGENAGPSKQFRTRCRPINNKELHNIIGVYPCTWLSSSLSNLSNGPWKCLFICYHHRVQSKQFRRQCGPIDKRNCIIGVYYFHLHVAWHSCLLQIKLYQSQR